MAAQEPAGKRKGKMSPTTIIIVLGVALIGGAYFLYRQRQSANAAQSAANVNASPSTEDFAGQIATLQAEVADLQSSAAQEQAGETGTGTTGGTTGGTAALKAPGLSVTPHQGGADFGWGAVSGAKAYELEVTGAGGKGTGTSHYDHAGTTTHARVTLAKGAYKARVRAGRSLTDIHGPWSAWHGFVVPAKQLAKQAG